MFTVPSTSEDSPAPSSFSSSAYSSMSPLILVVVIVLSLIFFIGVFVHLVLRIFIKRSASLVSLPMFQSSTRYSDSSSSRNIRRQLQHLFWLHDSGLDQAVIDSLPVFCCKDIVRSSHENFDCAICLCEFSEHEKLRLLPSCGHAFHMDCIDTWLLSNSTCPLCRGIPLVLSVDEARGVSRRFNEDGDNVEELAGVEKRVFSVRLGKFRSSGYEGMEETSRCNMDARRCYSMGTYQYVVGDSDLRVALPHEGKKINGCRKGESFSVSKIWLWSKKNKFTGSLNNDNVMPSFNVTFQSHNVVF